MALLGMAYSQAGQHALARQYLLGAAQRQPGNAGFRYQLGQALERAADPAGAKQAYLEALRLNPSFAEARRKIEALQAAAYPRHPGLTFPPPTPAPASGYAPPSVAPAGTFAHQPMPQYVVPSVPSYSHLSRGAEAPDMQVSDAFFRRVGARLIDGFLLLILIGGVMMLGGLGLVGAMAPNPNSEDTAAAGAMGLLFFAYVVAPLALYLYMILMHYARGQTLGQMALGIRVVNADGGKPGFGQVLLRDTIGHWIAALFCGIGTFWMLWDPQQQTWADKISSTYVRRA